MNRYWINRTLLTDLYELTMAVAYFEHDMHDSATFSLFVRQYPPNRGYFISAGLNDVLEFLENFTFTSDDLEFLESRGVSADGPYTDTDMAYKLVKYAGNPTLKLSSGKKTLVDRKQIYRQIKNGRWTGDTIALRDEILKGKPLLEPVMEDGKRLKQPEPLTTAQKRFQEHFAALEDRYKAIREPDAYPVHLSSELKSLQSEVVHEVMIKKLGES